jgi:hypothetical protein
MFNQPTNTASFFSILIAALIFSLSLAGVATAQGNTSLGIGALQNNTTGSYNTATGFSALLATPRSPKQPLYPDNRREKPLIVATRE